jgi:hypothetical protein
VAPAVRFEDNGARKRGAFHQNLSAFENYRVGARSVRQCFAGAAGTAQRI